MANNNPYSGQRRYGRDLCGIMRAVNEIEARIPDYPQTEWYGYTLTAKTSLGTPDGGVSVPSDSALVGKPYVAKAIVDVRNAIVAIVYADYFRRPDTGDLYTWDEDANNLYLLSMGDRTDYGATGGSRYTWTRTLAQMVGTKTYDIDIGELDVCVNGRIVNGDTIGGLAEAEYLGNTIIDGVWFVRVGGDGDGTSWANALGSIQAAVDVAQSGDEIWVMHGTYTTATPAYAVLTMKNGVALYGGFAGTETLRTERNWTTNVTTIDGEDTRRCVIGTNNATLDGFTITRGRAEYGAGMNNNGSSPTITNCTFFENSADYRGGGMFNYNGSSPTITNCTFSGNTAPYGGGGGVYNNDGTSPTITNCTFSGNTAPYGGGMYNTGSSPTITNCTFSGNTPDDIYP